MILILCAYLHTIVQAHIPNALILIFPSRIRLTQTTLLGRTITTNLELRRVGHLRDLVAQQPALRAQQNLGQRLTARSHTAQRHPDPVHLLVPVAPVDSVAHIGAQLVRRVVRATGGLLEANVARRRGKDDIAVGLGHRHMCIVLVRVNGNVELAVVVLHFVLQAVQVVKGR